MSSDRPAVCGGSAPPGTRGTGQRSDGAGGGGGGGAFNVLGKVNVETNTTRSSLSLIIF